MLLSNMRTRFNIFLFLFLFLFLSCKSKTDKNNSDLPITKLSGIDTIRIDLDTVPANLSFIDLFSYVEPIPLQTTEISSMDNCQKMIINEENINKYVILDARKIELFSFDSIGNFIQKSPLNIKESPYSILHLNWFFDSGNSFIYNSLDSLYMYYSGDKFFMYDNKTLKCIRKEKINLDSLYLSAFIPLSNDIYVFQGISNRMQEEWGDNICFYSKSEDSIIKKQIILQKIEEIHTFNSPLSSFDNRYFFQSNIVSDTIYEIHLDSLSVTPFLIVDYGNKAINEDNKYNFYVEKDRCFGGVFKSKRFAYLLNMLQNNQSYWFFSRFNGNIYISVCNKSTKKIQTVPAYNFLSIIPLLTDEVLYCLIGAGQVQEVIDSGILTEENANRLAKVKPDDNPVILKCYLK